MPERGKVWMWCEKRNISMEHFSFEREENRAIWKTESIGVVKKRRERIVLFKKSSIVLFKEFIWVVNLCSLSCLIIICNIFYRKNFFVREMASTFLLNTLYVLFLPNKENIKFLIINNFLLFYYTVYTLYKSNIHYILYITVYSLIIYILHTNI